MRESPRGDAWGEKSRGKLAGGDRDVRVGDSLDLICNASRNGSACTGGQEDETTDNLQ